MIRKELAFCKAVSKISGTSMTRNLTSRMTKRILTTDALSAVTFQNMSRRIECGEGRLTPTLFHFAGTFTANLESFHMPACLSRCPRDPRLAFSLVIPSVLLVAEYLVKQMHQIITSYNRPHPLRMVSHEQYASMVPTLARG